MKDQKWLLLQFVDYSSILSKCIFYIKEKEDIIWGLLQVKDVITIMETGNMAILMKEVKTTSNITVDMLRKVMDTVMQKKRNHPKEEILM